ncbi:type I-G CRISPR-associated protein Cas8g1/Csx17 [Methanothrix sp.]|uniref:type I-G CRISPR-associated protein Cas8g1/Csx17 n=1 Tax=Methanothrix sp. TaxID=90426 RepID=UPI003C738630
MSRLILKGCTPEPFSAYLTSLAVLRLVSEQKDLDAKGYWQNGFFCLDSELDEDRLLCFFQEEYVPTPIVSPWTGGSGFLEGDNTEGLDAIRSSTSSRFEIYRETIDKIFSFPEAPPTGLSMGAVLSILEKEVESKRGKARDKILEMVKDTRIKAQAVSKEFFPSDPFRLSLSDMEKLSRPLKDAERTERERSAAAKGLLKPFKKALTEVKKFSRSAGKERLILACRSRLSERAVEWIDAVSVIDSEGNAEYPPILGSGGNEGRLDYSNTFMKCLNQLLLSSDKEEISQELLRNALFGEAVEGLPIVKMGQYNPGRSGGFNQGPGIENKNFPANPWSFVLTLEGTIAWASSVARRQIIEKGFLRSPFTVRASPIGYSSSSEKDDVKSRAEIWVPIWTRPAGYQEFHAFLSEGRADVGRRSAATGLEFAEAVSSLGIDRGVSEFVRYSLLKRRGENYVALPSGHFEVQDRSESDLVRELDPLLKRIDRFLGGFKEPPAQFSSARRRIDKAILGVLLHGGAYQVKDLVMALGAMEQLIAQRDPFKPPKLSSPSLGLSPKWLVAIDDGSLEVRIATSLASIGGMDRIGPIRANLAPVDPEKPWSWAKGKGQQAWSGCSLATKMASVLERRMMDAQRLNCRSNPLYGAIPLRAEDIAAFIEGNIDEKVVEDLLFGLTWIRWDDRHGVEESSAKLMKRWAIPAANGIILRSWALLKLLFMPGSIRLPGGEEIFIKPESSIVPLLLAGRIDDACVIASRRLYQSDYSPIRSHFPETINGDRIAAALLLPLRGSQGIIKLTSLKRDN